MVHDPRSPPPPSTAVVVTVPLSRFDDFQEMAPKGGKAPQKQIRKIQMQKYSVGYRCSNVKFDRYGPLIWGGGQFTATQRGE
jgi:hypothetical protein